MSKNLFLKNKSQRKPTVCVCRHKPTYAGHTLCTQAQVCIRS